MSETSEDPPLKPSLSLSSDQLARACLQLPFASFDHTFLGYRTLLAPTSVPHHNRDRRLSTLTRPSSDRII